MAPPFAGGEEDEEARWCGLSTDMMEMILKHLPIADHISVSIACKSWRLATSDIILPALRAPWLLGSPMASTSLSWGFYTSSNGGQSLGLEIPTEFQRQWCCGSSKGWLMHLREPRNHSQYYEAHLLNPITGATVELPPFPPTVIKGVISTSPFATDFMLAALCFESTNFDKYVIVYQPRHPRRKKILIDNAMDIMFHHGRLYILTDLAELLVGVFDPRWKVSFKSIPTLFEEEGRHPDTYWGKLVESNDGVFVVYCTITTGAERQQLKVFKIKEWGRHHRIVEVKSLGDRTFFVGPFSDGVSISKMKSSSKLNIIKPDHIYYITGSEYSLWAHCMQKRHTFRVEEFKMTGNILEWFIPKLEDRSNLMVVTPTHSTSLLLTIIIVMLAVIGQCLLGWLSI
ncbi:hypothetical protein MUK42_12979 [Musa troglodytarum]|uniref:F-box domain-containing protein n=2 Tax=Musa troglodytarum TaxID=320322 RepID=A0A9E7KM33_9LILI|nr:hypothetical protein MUK42_12979 [Musa troglodytarum]